MAPVNRWLLRYSVPQAAAVLVPIAVQRSDATSSRAALAMLRKVPGEESFAALMSALESADPHTRIAALAGLAERRDPRSAGRLARLRYFDEDPGVRRAAARALDGIAAQKKI